jgi:predicted dehydrogenase
MAPAPLRVAIVGIGFGQQAHLPAFRADPRCEVVCLCASSQERAARIAAQHGVPGSSGDWRAVVDDTDVDALSIATPPAVQAEIALAALARGKPVFCEKPLALDLAGAEALARAARESGVANMVDFEFPEIPVWREAKRLLGEGLVGPLRHAAVTWHGETYANRMRTHSWKTAIEEGGGALSSMGSHALYNVEWLLGRVDRMWASLARAPSDDRSGDTLALLALELATKLPVTMSISTHTVHGGGHRIELFGDEGTLVLENRTSDYVSGFRLLHGTREQAEPRPLALADAAPQSGGDGRVAVVAGLARRFIDWAIDGTPSGPTFEDGLRAQRLLDAATRSHLSGCWADVPR